MGTGSLCGKSSPRAALARPRPRVSEAGASGRCDRQGAASRQHGDGAREMGPSAPAATASATVSRARSLLPAPGATKKAAVAGQRGGAAIPPRFDRSCLEPGGRPCRSTIAAPRAASATPSSIASSPPDRRSGYGRKPAQVTRSMSLMMTGRCYQFEFVCFSRSEIRLVRPRHLSFFSRVPLHVFSTNHFRPPVRIAHIRHGCCPRRREDAFILDRES
jgi:hypothetical protein